LRKTPFIPSDYTTLCRTWFRGGKGVGNVKVALGPIEQPDYERHRQTSVL
jgi:hypothetical protein